MSIDRFRLNWAASAALRKQSADDQRLRRSILAAIAILFIVAFVMGYTDGLNELALASQERSAP